MFKQHSLNSYHALFATVSIRNWFEEMCFQLYAQIVRNQQQLSGNPTATLIVQLYLDAILKLNCY